MLRRRLPAALAGALVIVVCLGWSAAPAHAHALLRSSEPADGTSLERSPAEALLTFTETLDPVLSGVRVLDSSGKQVEGSKAEPVPGQPAQLRVSLGELPKGLYTLAWRVTSPSDGHTTVGSVAFGVGVPAVAVGGDGGAAMERMPSPTAASVAGRWLFYAGVVLLLGAAVFGVTVVSDPAVISRSLLAAAWTAAAAGVLLTIGDQRATTRVGLADLFSSSTGHRLRTEVVAVALAGLAVGWAWRRRSRSALALVGVGASAAMLARALAGHANASSVRWFTVGTQWVHLVSVGAWIGGLVWLLMAMRRHDPGQGRGLARRFSRMAGWTLVVVALSGSLRALDEVGAWDGLFDARFGLTLRIKVALFAGLVVLGALGRFRHLPAAVAGRMDGLRRTVSAEVAIGAGVLGATAVLAGLPPSASLAAASKPRTPADLTVSGHDYATSVRVRLVVSPGSVGTNRFEFTVADYDTGKLLPAETVSLRFRLQDRPDVGSSTLDLTDDRDLRWRGSGNVLSIAGRWHVTALIQTATDAFEVPMELEPVAAGPSTAGAPVGASSCGEGKPDPTYNVSVESSPDPPRAEGTTFRLTVRQEGRAVVGAKVCVAANMPAMQHPGVNTVAKEAAAGRYEADLKFAMTGDWAATVTIAEPGAQVVSVPVDLEVK